MTLQHFPNFSESLYMAEQGVASKVAAWIKAKLHTARAREVIKDVRIKRDDIKNNIHEIKTTLNGEDRWFLKLCDSKDPEEKECPPGYLDRPEKE